MKISHTPFLLSLFLLLPIGAAAQVQPLSDDHARASQAFVDGIMLYENGNYEEALDYLTIAHLKLHEEPGVNLALANVYLSLHDFANAEYYAKTAVNLAPENKWYHLKLAEIHRRTGRDEATINAYKKALEYHPDEVNIMQNLAEAYVEFGELLEANQVYNKIIDRRGSSFEIHRRKFQNFNALQMQDSALVELEHMRKIDPGNLPTLRAISQYYREIGKTDRALEVLQEARDRNARDPQTLLLMAEVYVERSQWDELGEIFVSMLEDPLIYPSQKKELVRFMYAQHQRNPGDQQLADQTAEVLLTFSESESEYGPAQLLAAEFFMQRNEQDKALKKLEKVNELMPEEPEAWRQRLQILFSREQYQEIISLSDKANEYSPDDAFIQFFTGLSYLLNDEPETAAEWLENATLAPANRNLRSVIHGSLGDALQDLERWEDAVDAYEQALRLDPNNHNAMNNYAYFMAVRGEQLDYALELAENAISFEPENSAYLDTIGWIYYKKEEYEKAYNYIKKSVETGDASAEVFEHLGDVYYALDQNENAIEWWEKALSEDSDRDYLDERIQSARP